MKLSEFESTTEIREYVTGWGERLPDDIQSQIVASRASHLMIARWLHSIGHADATTSKVKTLREKRGVWI